MWKPVTLDELTKEINVAIPQLTHEQLVFWQQIKITPEKWEEKGYGDEGGGFWVVAVFGKKVIWYNDIEEGFNVSHYTVYGKIDEYGCEQDQLNRTINKILSYTPTKF
ncbi:hypothetical protein [Flavobacterium rhizosphaerae]|uniref:Uncharacterized protein n=1 Tax=Flavobacterium rhizosphaerae TaxID=3163298 RepID=A0ABW8YV44_9FLAO